jgi:hypothetical protein
MLLQPIGQGGQRVAFAAGNDFNKISVSCRALCRTKFHCTAGSAAAEGKPLERSVRIDTSLIDYPRHRLGRRRCRDRNLTTP